MVPEPGVDSGAAEEGRGKAAEAGEAEPRAAPGGPRAWGLRRRPRGRERGRSETVLSRLEELFTRSSERQKDEALQTPERKPRGCFLGPFPRVGRGCGEERYLLAVRCLKLFIAVYYVTLGCYLSKQPGCLPLMEEEVGLATKPIDLSE